MRTTARWTTIFGSLLLTACATDGDSDGPGGGKTDEFLSFEEFKEQTYRETDEDGEPGPFIVNGDTVIAGEKLLREFYDEMVNEGLIVHRPGRVDVKWNKQKKMNLTYCISDGFRSAQRTRVKNAMKSASERWEARGNVNFVHLEAEDGADCNRRNTKVVFDVSYTQGEQYLARAFFPNEPRRDRQVLIDESAFDAQWSLPAIMGHELGHVLGFRHEHTRPESGTCFEDREWRPLTPYDGKSIMHYPHCNGESNSLSFSDLDGEGAAAAYGEPGEPIPDEPGSVERNEIFRGEFAPGRNRTFQRLRVVPGTTLTATMTGTGDIDLYVRIGRQPTLENWDCRPFRDDSAEECSLTIPEGESTAYVEIRNDSNKRTSYEVAVQWFRPE